MEVLDKVEGSNTLKVVEKFGNTVDLHRGAIRKGAVADLVICDHMVNINKVILKGEIAK